MGSIVGVLGVRGSVLCIDVGVPGGGVSPSGLRLSPGGGWGEILGVGGRCGGGVVIRSVPDKSALLLHLLG